MSGYELGEEHEDALARLNEHYFRLPEGWDVAKMRRINRWFAWRRFVSGVKATTWILAPLTIAALAAWLCSSWIISALPIAAIGSVVYLIAAVAAIVLFMLVWTLLAAVLAKVLR